MSDMTNKEKKAALKKEMKEKQKAGEMPFLDHLEELRWHIIRSLVAVFVMAIIAFILQRFIFEEIIFKPMMPDFFTNRMFSLLADKMGSEDMRINQNQLELINIALPGQFNMSVWTAMVAGLILAAPIVSREFWQFIKPALYEHEKKVASGAAIYTSLLFIVGILFGYYLIVPLSIQFFNSYTISTAVSNQINITSYVSIVTTCVLASGVVFLLPVFSYALTRVGLLTPGFMKTYRKHAYVLLLLLSAIITPPDVFSQILVAIPLVMLYELSIFISGRVVRNMERKEKSLQKEG